VIGNGVDLDKFEANATRRARLALGIDADAQVWCRSAASANARGFTASSSACRSCCRTTPSWSCLIVGGPSPDGDWTDRLRQMVSTGG
jgi:hypothetical protein